MSLLVLANSIQDWMCSSVALFGNEIIFSKIAYQIEVIVHLCRLLTKINAHVKLRYVEDFVNFVEKPRKYLGISDLKVDTISLLNPEYGELSHTCSDEK